MISIPGYEIDKMIYDGTRAEIYRGIRTKDKLDVALKIVKSYLPVKDIARFEYEYKYKVDKKNFFEKNGLKFGLVIMAIGLGSLLANLVIINVPSARDSAQELYFSLIANFGGIALLLNYAIERKEKKENEKRENGY